jgi:2-oxoglutarate ferredoxin oxidoreductase subunit beta
VPYFEDITIEQDPGTTHEVTLHNGSKIVLTKMAEDYSPTDKAKALQMIARDARARRVRDGHSLLEPDKQDFVDMLGIVDEPLAFLPDTKTRPGKQVLEEIMESFR